MTSPRLLSAEDGLTQYLDAVAAALRGPRRRRQRILAELREGVEQSTIARATRGVTREQALTDALTEFGRPTVIASAFDPEMAIADVRRILSWLLATGPLVGIWWLLLLHPQPWLSSPAALVTAVPVTPLVAITMACAVATFAATGRLIRWIPEATPKTALAAASAVAALVLVGDITIIAVGCSHASAEPLGIAAIGASLARTVGGVSALHGTATWRHRLSSPS